MINFFLNSENHSKLILLLENLKLNIEKINIHETIFIASKLNNKKIWNNNNFRTKFKIN